LIHTSPQGGVKCVAQMKVTVPAGTARKQSYHLQPRC